DKIKKRKEQKVTNTNKKNVPPIGGAADIRPHPKRAVKAAHRSGMNPYGNQCKPEYAEPAPARPGDTPNCQYALPQHPDWNRVKESQDMENIELCISTPSTIRSCANIDEIEQWTRGATAIRAQQTRDHFDKEV
ncbi:16561_t:CDS:2, partial [Gigaspora rosea]